MMGELSFQRETRKGGEGERLPRDVSEKNEFVESQRKKFFKTWFFLNSPFCHFVRPQKILL